MAAARTATVAQVSDRYSDEAFLAAGIDNLDNTDTELVISQIAGFGDCLILEAMVVQVAIATWIVPVADRDWHTTMYVVDTNSVVIDFIGVGKLGSSQTTAAGGRLSGVVKPDQPVMWHQGERIFVEYPVTDSDATDVSDLRVWFRVKRLRNTGRPS